jgi:peptide deformylase
MFGSAELQQLIDDMFETMRHVGGVGLAAPQIGIDLQLVIFGFERSERYPDAEAVPQTILLNPVITPTSSEVEDGWEGCLSVPGLRGVVPRFKHISYRASTPGQPDQPLCRRLPCAGGAARVRPPDRPAVPLAHPGLCQFGYTEVLFPGLEVSDD